MKSHRPSRPAGGYVCTCTTTGKRAYLTRRDARAAARATATGARAFRCTHCSYWHSGHQHGLPRHAHQEHHQNMEDPS